VCFEDKLRALWPNSTLLWSTLSIGWSLGMVTATMTCGVDTKSVIENIAEEVGSASRGRPTGEGELCQLPQPCRLVGDQRRSSVGGQVAEV
jgi:hypothetical protein